VWDTDLGVCLLVVTDHAADVYAIVSHPARPFTYASCSRDSTVRLWEVGGGARQIRYIAAASASLEGLFPVAADDRPTPPTPSVKTAAAQAAPAAPPRRTLPLPLELCGRKRAALKVVSSLLSLLSLLSLSTLSLLSLSTLYHLSHAKAPR